MHRTLLTTEWYDTAFSDAVESFAHSLLIICMLGRSCTPLHIFIDQLLVKRRPRKPPLSQEWSAQPSALRLKICLISSQAKASIKALVHTLIPLRPVIKIEGAEQAEVFPSLSPNTGTRRPSQSMTQPRSSLQKHRIMDQLQLAHLCDLARGTAMYANFRKLPDDTTYIRPRVQDTLLLLKSILELIGLNEAIEINSPITPIIVDCKKVLSRVQNLTYEIKAASGEVPNPFQKSLKDCVHKMNDALENVQDCSNVLLLVLHTGLRS
jgi:hypothetical protein